MTLVGYGLEQNKEIVHSLTTHEKAQLGKSMRFAAVLGCLLMVFMLIGRFFIEDMEQVPPVAAFASGLMMFLLMIFIGSKDYKKSMIAYEGEVYKVKEKRRKVEKNMDSDRYDRHYQYVLYIKKNGGGKKKHMIYEAQKPSHKGQQLLKYYEGARVKKFQAIAFPEKYDKRRDVQSLCLICGAMGDRHVNYCKQCGTQIF